MPTAISLLSDHHTSTALMPAILTSPGIKCHKITQLKTGSPEEGIMDLIHSLVTTNPNHKDPFYVLDLARVVDLFSKWSHHLPTVRPFYAVKCNPNTALLSTLAALGAGFDCASRGEIEAVLTLGVSPDRIIYANPCKPEPHIAYAAKAGVGLTTFDSVYELDKIRRHHPGCSLLLRLKAPDDNGALRPLGTKYGALPEEVSPLLLAAQAASLPVIGVSFHVGSGATNFGTYDTAIRSARAAFDAAHQLGLPRMHVLNVGGGFTAGRQFEEAATVIRASIEAHFGGWADLEVIAEPGRIMAETAFTLATCVIGKRVRGERREYWINDGIHGSMACIKNDTTAGVEVAPVAAVSDPGNVRCHGKKTHRSTVFGPTCDALDMVLAGVQLPELEVGDWLVSPNMGAYTASLGSSFNGFDTSAIRVILANSTV